MTLNRDIGIKEIIGVFVLIGAIYGGIIGIASIASTVSLKQIDEHTIVTEQKHVDQFNELRSEQALMQTDVAVTKERVKTMGEDITEIKEMLRDAR